MANNEIAIKIKLDDNGAIKGIENIKGAVDDVKKADGSLGWKGMKDGASAAEAASGGFTVAKGVIADLAANAVMAAVDGVKQLGASIVDLGKQSLDAYASYEQLTGGVETLFKDSADQVMRYAGNAFETAGMSANAYMETVTSFSASLLQSLGGDTEEAASYAHRAVIDMSDNANKMGSSIQDIQNAYQGFAKQNYTMLDNLKLGYGGTQEEMQRLIADAAEMTDVQEELGLTVDASSMSFGNIVNAIHVMQESMGIAGTTSLEAATTIEGSINSMKGAWENWMVSLAEGSPEVIAENTQALVDSVITAADNIIPRVVQIAESAASAVVEYLPDAAKQIGEGIMGSLPEEVRGPIEDALGALDEVQDTVEDVIETVEKVADNSMPAIEATWSLAWDAMSGAADAVMPVISSAMSTVGTIAESVSATVAPIVTDLVAMIQERMPEIQATVEAVMGTVSSVLDGVGVTVQTLCDLMATAWPYISEVIGGAMDVVLGVIETVWPSIQGIIDSVMGVIQGVISTVTAAIKGDWSGVWNGIKTIVSSVWNGIKSVITGAVNAVSSVITGTFNGVKTTVGNIFNGIKNAITGPIEAAKNTVKGIVDAIKGFFSNFKISLPHINLPHFSIKPSGWQIGDLLEGKIPSLGIDWYAKGGEFNSAHIIGVGEAGRETVLPLTNKQTMRNVGEAISEAGGLGSAETLKKLDAIIRLLEDQSDKPVRMYVGQREFARAVKETEGYY